MCYAVYLGCLCYGAYLQRYYARHSRWFWLFAGLLAARALGYGLALKRKPLELLLAWLTLTMSGGVWWLRQLNGITWAKSLSTGRLFEWNADLNLEKYLPLIQPSPALFAALAVLAAVYLLAAGLTLREKEKSGGTGAMEE